MTILHDEAPQSNRPSDLFERFLDYDPVEIAKALEMIRRNRHRDVARARILFNTPPLGCGYYVNLNEEKGGA